MCLWAISGFVHAQTQVPELMSFRGAFKANIDKLWEVYNFRGANFDCDYEDDEYEKYVFDFLKTWQNVPKPPVLLFYSKSEDSLKIWAFANDKVDFAAVAVSNARLVELETSLRNSLKVENTRGTEKRKWWKRNTRRGANIKTGKPASTWSSVSDTLSQLLFPPNISKVLTGKGHLFLLPELNIGQLPIWLLKPWGKNSILADSMSYSQVPHVCQFISYIKSNDSLGYKQAIQFKNPLVVGNPVYAQSLGLSSLPGAEKEAEEVAKLLNTGAVLGANADVEGVRKKMKNADLIYLATHAQCSMEDILYDSWIALSPTEYDKEGKLVLYDIQRMKFEGQMAVLSACQTGYGKVLEGGFVGLGRAFFKAGIDFTVMSLWSVNDRSAAYLMSRYMKYVLEPHYYNPAEPLRKAILDTRKVYPNPADWAAFQLFGFTK